MPSLRAKRHEIANLLRHAESLGLSRAAKQRLYWFSYALAHGGNVSLTCRYFGISRATFLRWAKRFDPRRPETLEEHSRRPHRVRAPETDSVVIERIRQYRSALPTMGKEQIAIKLQAEHGITVSASTVGRVIARHRFFFADRPSHSQKRTGVDLSPGPLSTLPRSSASSAPQEALKQGSGEVGEAAAPVSPDSSPDGPAPDSPAFDS